MTQQVEPEPDLPSDDPDDEPGRLAEELEDGTLDPDELHAEPAWWNEGSDDET